MLGSSPLDGILVLEFAGLAPGPFAGKLLADYGAQVLRIDRHDVEGPTPDLLAEHKRSIAVNIKTPAGASLVTNLARKADVLIDPFRPGVMERLGFGPNSFCNDNPRLIYARITGFRRDGKYKDMAGHDINYIAVSGALSLLGRAHDKPYAPANILGDFAGGGATCFAGILLALVQRGKTGRGQIVEANMVDGSAYLTTFPRFCLRTPFWHAERGNNLLDGGAPFYDTYQTKDGGFMAVGALEPQFYQLFVSLLFPENTSLPDRSDPANWDQLREMITQRFLENPRDFWEQIFDGKDACVTPVKTHAELNEEGFDQRPMVKLQNSSTRKGLDWKGLALRPGEGGKEALEEWWGWKEGREWTIGTQGFGVVQSVEFKAKI